MLSKVTAKNVGDVFLDTLVIADNVSTMHVHRCAYNSCNTVQCVHMPMSTSESWFTFNHARIFSAGV